ncbi:glycosyltransferase [Novosphingobium bradum]|uniref:Glycosyltransferase n=1 Tax=Novosphingobium bradum TaxID=1737444 RepID=A0ABV7IWU5_9SPHN
MSRRKPLKVALIWAQFAAYHVDRCEAVGRRLAPRAQVLAIEVATTSADYAWEPSGAIAGAEKVTLFAGQSFDAIPWWRRFAAMLRATWRCDVVCMGLSYGLIDAILLGWTLRLLGRRLILFSDSKFDDKPRSAPFELLKAALLGCYGAAIGSGRRTLDYLRFLGFARRPRLPGYDCVGVDRIRAQAGLADGLPDATPEAAFSRRPFVFIGRFVDKKNLATLVEGHARYVALAGAAARPLRLIGSGPLEHGLRARVADLGIAGMVDFPGFLPAEAVSRALAGALALVLVSREEQWGLVVNEALALGLPVIVSNEVGARDLLVRNLVNGFVVDSHSPEAIAEAMRQMSADEAAWRAMARASRERAWMGDAERLADALEVLLFPPAAEAAGRIDTLFAQLETTPQ